MAPTPAPHIACFGTLLNTHPLYAAQIPSPFTQPQIVKYLSPNPTLPHFTTQFACLDSTETRLGGV